MSLSISGSSGSTASKKTGSPSPPDRSSKSSEVEGSPSKQAEAARSDKPVPRSDSTRRDAFSGFTRESTHNTLAAPSAARSDAPFWQDKGSQTHEAMKNDAKAQWKEHLGRDVSDSEASQLADQAQRSGCVNEQEAHAYFEHMVKGSAEYAVNQDVRGQFKALLGRDPGAQGAQQVMKDWKLPAQPAAARAPLFDHLTASAEFKAQHPEGVSTPLTSVDQANQHWVSQWGPTASNSGGHPYGFSDCGPTSAVTLASALGLQPRPSPSGAEKAIDAMRDRALGFNSTESRGTNEPQMDRALTSVGARCEENLPPTLATVDQALSEGKMLMSAGDPWNAWGKAMSQGPHGTGKQVDYLNSKDPGGHWVAVLGKTPEGKYLVSDPLSKKGAISVTGAQLQQYFRDGKDSSGAMSVWNPKGSGPGVSMPPPPHIDVPPGPGAASSTPATPAPPATPAIRVPQVALQAGDRGAQVEQLQKALVAGGYLADKDMKTGPGLYGPKTQAAVARLQQQYGITGDAGKDFGPRTREALERSLRGDKPQAPAPQAPTAPATGSSGVTHLSAADRALAARIDAQIARFSPPGKLNGCGAVLVEACRQNHVPVDMALSMLQKESSFLSPANTASIANHNPGNMRFPRGEAWAHEIRTVYGGKPGGRGGFTQFPSIEQGLRAYARLMRHTYGTEVDKRDWTSLIGRYCPPSDNRSASDPTGQKFTQRYIDQMSTFSAQWRDRLGIGTSWVNG